MGQSNMFETRTEKKDTQTKNDGLLFWALFKLGSCRLMTEMGGEYSGKSSCNLQVYWDSGSNLPVKAGLQFPNESPVRN